MTNDSYKLPDGPIAIQVNPNRSLTWAQLIDHAQLQQDWVFEQENDVYCDTGFGGGHD
ncbi:MAG: hypothetical protein ACO3JV_13425 [Pseudomonadales bacterium]